jgi:hypothetical protein
VIRTAAGRGVESYCLFGVRDTDSGRPALMYQFGITRRDYTPKPAYHRFRELVAELS